MKYTHSNGPFRINFLVNNKNQWVITVRDKNGLYDFGPNDDYICNFLTKDLKISNTILNIGKWKSRREAIKKAKEYIRNEKI